MTSTLNPFAPPFVPVVYRAVEDFSPEWWELVESSVWFQDYWLRECFEEPNQEDVDDDNDPELLDNYGPALPDTDSLFYSCNPQQEEKEGKDAAAELVAWGAEKWRGPRGRLEGPRFLDKAPKIVNVKVSPRTIQQPR